MNPPRLTPKERLMIVAKRSENPQILQDVRYLKFPQKQNVARLIVDYVYHVSPHCFFEPVLGTRSAWLLKPDSWIALQFGGYKITVSVRVLCRELESIESAPDMDVMQGRYRGLARFRIASLTHVPVAFRYIEYAFYKSKTEYRISH